MPYMAISDFKYGLDRRRPQTSGIPGTLWYLKNAFITRGGDIERAKKFAVRATLPAGTFGLRSINNTPYVFGSATPPTMPVDVTYQQLAAPGAPAMVRLIDAKAFDGKIYAIAEYADGNIYHFYNGTRVTAWDTLADAAAKDSALAAYLASRIDSLTEVDATSESSYITITAATPGVPFTISGSATDTNSNGSAPVVTIVTLRANVTEVPEVRATGTITITGGTASPGVNRIVTAKVNGVDLIAAPVDWVNSNSDTANSLVVAINNSASTHHYTASAVGNVVTIKAAVGTGATPNGYTVATTVSGTVTTSTANMSGGTTYVAPVAQISRAQTNYTTFDSTDVWTVTINGTSFKASGRAGVTGNSIYVNQGRVYSTVGSLIYGCKLNTPTDWSDTSASSGALFINIGTQSEGATQVTCAVRYNGLTAIFGRDAVIVYTLNADNTQNGLKQVLENTGTIAPLSAVSYGANDVFYLDKTGIRSLRTRETVGAAYASDVGSAIDSFIQSIITEIGFVTAARSASVIEALDGRYMLALGRYIIALSMFPSSRITAWSYIDFESTITDLVRVGRDLLLRSGDTVYLYGGRSGSVYPDANEFPVLVETPFMAANDVAAEKFVQGFDMAAQNTWKVQILNNPNNPASYVDVGNIVGTTYNQDSIRAYLKSSHFALRFTCTEPGYATLSSTAVHFYKGQTE